MISNDSSLARAKPQPFAAALQAQRGLPMRFALIGAICAVAGCPRTEPSGVAIADVNPMGSPEPPAFSLEILGHGFGLSDVVIDLKEGKGTANGTQLRVQIVDAAGVVPQQVSSTSTKLESSNRIVASVTLNGPLAPGAYGVLLFSAGTDQKLAELMNAFEVTGATPRPDAGPPADAALDGGVDPADVDPFADAADDAGLADDALSPDVPPGDVEDLDAGVDDAGELDAAEPDAGFPPDSGLGPFEGAFAYRRPITLSNGSAADSPAGITFRVPVQHAQLVAAGRANADGSDLAVYLGTDRLDHTFEDRVALGTDGLILVVALPQSIPPGPAANLPLSLYYGDPAANLDITDAVFLFVQRFDAQLTIGTGNPDRWHSNNWIVQCNDRDNTAPGASICVMDDGSNPTRRSLGSPRVRGMSSAPPANEIYELVVFIGGRMVDQADDLLYFSYADANNNFAGSTILPDGVYLQFPPNAQQDFPETNGQTRVARGWLLPAAGLPYTLVRARFVPTQQTEPSLHFRYVSDNNVASQNSLVGVDDLTVRRALEPELGVILGPEEAR